MSNHDEVAHAWANQTGKARKGFNMFYEGETIYSYGRHFPIARIVHNGQSDRAYLMTDRGYSVSTAKHKSIVWRAMGYGNRWPVFVVADVNAISPQAHLANHEAMIKAARVALDKAKRARKYASMHLDDAKRSVDGANAYAQFWALGLPELTLETLDAAVAAIAARAEEMRAEAELARAKAAREKALRDRDTLKAWLCGADVYPPHTRVPYVRVSGDQVQTTWGARVPLNEALRAWSLMKAARDEHRELCVTPQGGLRVGDFSVEAINETGMRIGCHFIPYRFAKLAAVNAGIDA